MAPASDARIPIAAHTPSQSGVSSAVPGGDGWGGDSGGGSGGESGSSVSGGGSPEEGVSPTGTGGTGDAGAGAEAEAGVATRPEAGVAAQSDTAAGGAAEAGVLAVPAPGAWTQIGPGLEQRTWRVRPSPERAEVRMIAVRVAPAEHVFDVAYRPGEPLDLGSWQARTGATIVLNGGFFTEEFVATGLVVAGGQSFGSSYGAFAGMFAVTAAGPEVRWLGHRPHDPAEPLGAALQAFPMLVLPGGVRGFDEPGGETARRTVIGQDIAGRILLVVAPDGGFSLSDLSHVLTTSDLQLDVALNLDGGASTGMIVDAAPPLRIEAFGPLPTVITVRPRR